MEQFLQLDGRKVGMAKKDNRKDPCNDGTVLHLDYKHKYLGGNTTCFVQC